MQVDPVSAVHGGAVHPAKAELDRKVVQSQVHDRDLQVEHTSEVTQNQRLDEAQSEASRAPASAPIVTTSPASSPAVLAQAAQYQLYTQSGTLAAMLVQQGLAASAETPFH